MKFVIFALFYLAGSCRSKITIAAFDADTFKATIAKCFENWRDLKKEPSLTTNKAIIRSILKATIGVENPSILDSAGQAIELADYILDKYEAVSYHNICHAIMVSYYTYLIMNDIKKTVPGKDDTLPALLWEIKAAVFAGLFHDIGHPGVGNGHCSNQGVTDNLNKRFCIFKANAEKNACVVNFDKTDVFQSHITNDHLFGFIKVEKESLNDNANLVLAKLTGNFKSLNKINFFEIFCKSEELMHAIIAKKVLEALQKVEGVSLEPDFITMVILSILGTNMALYNFGGAANYEAITGFQYEYFYVVHIADLVGVGELDDALRRTMLKRVSREFLDEAKVANNQMYKGWYSNLQELLKSQNGFVSGFISPLKTKLMSAHSHESAVASQLIDQAAAFNYQDLINQVEDPKKQKTELFKKFESDYQEIKAENEIRIV